MLQGGAEWNDAVQQYSDSGKSNNGNLGTIRPDEVTPNFARAAFSLESDELSYVVETDRGFHIILRH
jgi:parvulin-like peptidyl-prolyl isomerase